MKLRIINQNGLFVPQFQKKGYYSTSWSGFGTPNVKFTKDKQALAFVELVESAAINKVTKKNEVIYTNFAAEGKI